MARKAFALLLCGFALGGVPCADADPFGALSSWRETPSFAPRGLTADPNIAKWLMTLPGSESWYDTAADQARSAEVFSDRPIGGEAYRLAPDAPSAQVADPSVARQLFDVKPMGSAPYRFTNPLAQSMAAAENTLPGNTAVEGRSASDLISSTTRRAHLETCTCMHK